MNTQPQYRVRQSIFGQISLASIAIAVGAVAVLFAVTYGTIREQTRAALSATVATDLAGLIDIYATSGEAELRQRIADREAVVSLSGREAHYLLARADGSKIAGDIAAWPPLSAALSEEGYVELTGGKQVYAHGARLGPDLQLLVAREYSHDREALERLSAIFLVAGTAIVAGVALVSHLTARHLARRMERVNSAFAAAVDGGAAHFPARRGGDEIDALAGHGARLLARQAHLLEAYKHVSDHVAHEVRTPLMHLDNRLGSAMAANPEEEGGPLGASRADVRSIVTMLDSLLDIASAESRRGERSGLVEIDLSQLLTDLAALYEGSVEDAGLTLETRIAPGIDVFGERMQLTRLVSNLLDNAIKYVPAGGTVTLMLSEGPRIEVSDDGPGIQQEDRARIFERFDRGSTRPGASGHGLGLALARAIAQRHNLTLRLAEGGQGAHFIVEPAP